MKYAHRFACVAAALAGTCAASGQVRITEWMYNGTAEFIEFTNFGPGPVDFTGWTFEDSDFGTPDSNPFDISGFGIVAPGETVVLTEAPEADFRADWGLAASVKIVGEMGVLVGNNIGRADSLILIDASSNVVDRLDYGDQVFVGSIRTNAISGVPITAAALGANDVFQWRLSVIGDEYNTYASLTGDVGNPGYYVPAPGVAGVFALAGLAGLRRRRA